MSAGRFTVGGAPAAGAEVLAFGGDPPRLQAIVTTDDDGRYEAPDVTLLLGRTTASPFAVAHGQPLEAPGPPCTVTLTFEGEAPERLRVFADPDGLPEPLDLLLHFSGPGALRPHVFELEGARELVLAPGRWRIGGDHVVLERPMQVDPGPPNVVVTGARVGGTELDGDERSGFALEVTADTALTLVLRQIADDEL